MSTFQIGDRVITPHGDRALVVDLYPKHDEVEVAWRGQTFGHKIYGEAKFAVSRLVGIGKPSR